MSNELPFLRKQTSSVDIDNIDENIKKKLIRDAKEFGLPSLTISSGYRTREKNDQLVRDTISEELSKFPNISSTEKNILKNAIWRKDGDKRQVNRGFFNNKINNLNISSERKQKLIKSIQKGRSNVNPESKHMDKKKFDLPQEMQSPRFKEFLISKGWHIHPEIKNGRTIWDMSLSSSFTPTSEKEELTQLRKEQEPEFTPDLMNEVLSQGGQSQEVLTRKPKSYDEMSFRDAFNQAWRDKGEGDVFNWKGKPYLLKRK